MNEIDLESGKKLRLSLASFSLGKELYQSFSEELLKLDVKFDDEMDINFLKNLILTFLSSKKIENCLWRCAEKCLYENMKVTQDLFENEEARQDYFEIMFHVAKRNLDPFVKALYAKYKDSFQKVIEGLKQ